MKVIYKGYEIEVNREESIGGDDMLYTSITRLSDGYLAEAFPEYGECKTVRSQIKNMKTRIDNELMEENPWGEFKKP